MEENVPQQNDQKKCQCHGNCCRMPCKVIGSILVSIFLIVLIFYFAQLSQNVAKERLYIGQDVSYKNTITVSDSAEVYAKPDLATTTATVVSDSNTVATALKDNTDKMNKITDFLKFQKIEDKDMKTTSFNIYPRYEYPAPSYKRIFVGYEITQSLLIKIRNLEAVGTIIDGVTKAGANEMSDLQFTIDKPDDLKNQARQGAIQKAKAKAEALASQLGVGLVRVSGFSENDGTTPPIYYMDKSAVVGLGGGEAAPVPQIQAGENKIEVNVSITYEIN
jgi:uncharacterized protein YggE